MRVVHSDAAHVETRVLVDALACRTNRPGARAELMAQCEYSIRTLPAITGAPAPQQMSTPLSRVIHPIDSVVWSFTAHRTRHHRCELTQLSIRPLSFTHTARLTASAALGMSAALKAGLSVDEVRRQLLATVAPLADKIVDTARFAVGNGSSTTLNYSEQDKEKQVTQEPPNAAHAADALAKAEPNGKALPAGLGGMDGVGVRTAPTVFITSTTASSEVTAFPLITVGPVIGLTTDTTTRILIESNTTMTVQMRLRMVERNVRLTRGNRRLHDQGQANSMLNSTTGLVHSPQPQPPASEHQPNSSASSTTSTTAASSAPSVANGHSTASPAQPADNFSRTAVTTTSLAQTQQQQLSASPSTLKSTESSDRGSTGTTIGTETASGVTSTERQPAPATNPSPAERQQVERDIDPAEAREAEGSYVTSPLSTLVERGGAQLLFTQGGPKPLVSGGSESLAEKVDDGHVIDKEVECTAHRVSVATFVDLTPDCRYEITFLNIKQRLASTVTTLLSSWQVSSLTPLDVAFVSCNLLSVTKDLALPESDLWLDLRRRVGGARGGLRVPHWRSDIWYTRHSAQHIAKQRCCSCHSI